MKFSTRGVAPIQSATPTAEPMQPTTVVEHRTTISDYRREFELIDQEYRRLWEDAKQDMSASTLAERLQPLSQRQQALQRGLSAEPAYADMVESPHLFSQNKDIELQNILEIKQRSMNTGSPIEAAPADPQEKPESSRKPKNKGERRDHRQEMTDLACEHIERGTAPWLTGGGAWPRNGVRGNIYHGINVMNLMAEDPRWCTFNQAKEKGWYVKKGEKSQPLYFFKPLVKEEEQLDGTVETKKIPYLTSYRVFNFSQLDRGSEPDLPDEDVVPLSVDRLTEEQRDIIDTIFENADPAIKQASVSGYSPSTDTIYLNTQYASDVDEAVDKIHQLCHWSGGPDRLARNFGESRQSTEYAVEELRACMASTMVCARLGIQHQLPGHDDYGALQVDALRGDKSLIYSIAKDAELICRHVCAFHPELREEMEQEYQQQMAAAVEAGAPAEIFDTSDIDFNDPVFDPQQGLKP